LRQIGLGRIEVSGPSVGLFKLLAADIAIALSNGFAFDPSSLSFVGK
jgi:hypothetical protein